MKLFGLFKKQKGVKVQGFSHDKAEYQWESALEEYCNQHGIEQDELDLDELDEEVENTIWEYAGNHIAFFLVWLIQHDFCRTEEYEEEGIALIKDEKMNAVEFLMNSCDGVLAAISLKEEILGFMDAYYEKHNRYFGDYCTFIEKVAGEKVLGVRFSWELYHQFSPVLDKAYQSYLQQSK